jgi:hypothetical protein
VTKVPDQVRNETIIRAMLRDNQKLDRKDGYYWIKFPHEDRKGYHWEPGSWDNRMKAWALIGSEVPWFEFQLIDVGFFIGDHMISPRYDEMN